jgi:hypothetical protein
MRDYLEVFSFSDSQADMFAAGQRATVEKFRAAGRVIARYVNEYWTSGQRQANSLHEVSYRACFKPQLPRFFVERLTAPGDTVYDPFGGRGTTAIEAALLGRKVVSNDINPLSRILTEPRLSPPRVEDVAKRLAEIPLLPDAADRAGMDLSMFYHPATLTEIVSLREYLDGKRNSVDNWIRMVATNRLTGHSSGFFSVYTLPPNQAVSPAAQSKINAVRRQTPPQRDTRAIIIRKTASLLADVDERTRQVLRESASTARFYRGDARRVLDMKPESVSLTVTSPPFLDVVQYGQDNWLRCWFNRIDADAVAERITMMKRLEDWAAVMQDVFHELYRVTRPGGWVAFEVGEVRGGTVLLDEVVAPLGTNAGFDCVGVMVNQQEFTKTANCWGVRNNSKGTNTNRIVLFTK